MAFHQTTIIGTVGQEPQVKHLNGGKTVCEFSVAVNEKWTTDGQQREKTTWYRVSAWGKLGDIISEYVNKGDSIFLIGNVSANAYMGSDGEPKASLNLTAQKVQFLGGNRDSGSDANEMPF